MSLLRNILTKIFDRFSFNGRICSKAFSTVEEIVFERNFGTKFDMQLLFLDMLSLRNKGLLVKLFNKKDELASLVLLSYYTRRGINIRKGLMTIQNLNAFIKRLKETGSLKNHQGSWRSQMFIAIKNKVKLDTDTLSISSAHGECSWSSTTNRSQTDFAKMTHFRKNEG